MELHIPILKMDLRSVFKTVSQFLLSNYHTKSHFTILKWVGRAQHTWKQTITVWHSEGHSRV